MVEENIGETKPRSISVWNHPAVMVFERDLEQKIQQEERELTVIFLTKSGMVIAHREPPDNTS